VGRKVSFFARSRTSYLPYLFFLALSSAFSLRAIHDSYGQLERAVDRVAHHLISVGLSVAAADPLTPAADLPKSPVIGVLVQSSINETIFEIALAKAGFVGLLLSVNNSAAAVAHLCQATGARTIIYGARFEKVAREANRILTDKSTSDDLNLIADHCFPAWGNDDVDDVPVGTFQAVYTPEQEKHRPAVILHSSGSVSTVNLLKHLNNDLHIAAQTGFPKPVIINHFSLVADATNNRGMPSFSTLPVFHGFGHACV
jgi:acyl-CoA synthetase (AMP-forming)/AMP-acid ligase II